MHTNNMGVLLRSWLGALSLGACLAFPLSANAQTDPPAPSFSVVAGQFGAGAATALVSVPVTLLAGSALGGLSGNLVVSALPPALLFLAVPPVLVSMSTAFTGNAMHSGAGFRAHPALWAGVGVQVAGLALGSLAGVYAQNFPSLLVFSLVTAVVLPAATVGVQYVTRSRVRVRTARREPPPLPFVHGTRVLFEGASTASFSLPIAGGSF